MRQTVNTDVRIHFSNTIGVKEYKAPTDVSIRLIEEFYHKTIVNILAKGEVNNNLVSGNYVLFNEPWNLYEYKFFFRFKINGQEFTIERSIPKHELEKEVNDEFKYKLVHGLNEYAEAMITIYMLKVFAFSIIDEVIGRPVPFMKELLHSDNELWKRINRK